METKLSGSAQQNRFNWRIPHPNPYEYQESLYYRNRAFIPLDRNADGRLRLATTNAAVIASSI